MDEQMEGIFAGVNEEVERRGKLFVEQSKDAIGDISSFFVAVDWTEPWIQGLLLFHLCLLLTILFFRKNVTVQFTVLFGMIALGGLSERINTLLATHWESFSRVHYFDEHGFFISAMLSGPIVIFSIIALINILITLFQMLITVKRQQILAQQEKPKKKKKND